MNVPPSKLLDTVSARRATREFLDAMRDSGDMGLFLGRARDRKLTTVEFPAFSMFGTGAHEMFIPRPKADTLQFIKVYEAYADRPLGWVKRPAQICSRIYSVDTHQLFSPFKADDEWWGPTMTLLAASQWLGTDVVSVQPEYAKLFIGNAVMEVSPDGCYVNSRRAVHPAACAPFDLHRPTTHFPAVRTNNAVLRALHEQLDDLPLRASICGNTVATALHEGLITNPWLISQILEIKNADQAPVHG